jgi:tetratricopeptide (TPR) repeat protein
MSIAPRSRLALDDARATPSHGRGVVWLLIVAAAIASGCAPKRTLPPAPVAIAHGEFVYPTLPPALLGKPGADLVDIGWRYLQGDDAFSAERTFSQALRRNAALYPARAGEGYVALSRRDFTRALALFDSALKANGFYAPALVGRGQTLLAMGREREAMTALEAALAADGSLADVRRRVEVLRFRGLQDVIEEARDLARKGRDEEARTAYRRALTASPESAFLHRELGLLERKAGRADQALQELNRAVGLDPSDAASLTQIGELLDQRSDFAGSEAAYRKAADIEPTPELSARIAATAKKGREARLPAEFTAALTAPQLSRGELAAIIGVRLEDVIADAPVRQVVITDTGGHWAAEWIGPVARAGVMDPFENHTFQPLARVGRGDLAVAVSRLLSVVAARDPEVRTRLAKRPVIADMTPRHVQYAAVLAAVASGVMPLLPGDRFLVAQQVTGAEAVDAIDRVRALAARTQPNSAF